MIKRISLICPIILIAAGFSFAATLPDEAAARDLANKIMEKVAINDFDGAFALMKPYCPLSTTEIDDATLQTKSMREQFGKRHGTGIGYEFLDSKKIGDVLLRLRYFEKTTNHALPWAFYFYKTKDGWMLNTFDWNDQFKDLF